MLVFFCKYHERKFPICEEGGGWRTLFAGRRAVVFQRQHDELVDGGEAGEVGGVLLGRAEDELAFLLEAFFFLFVSISFG